MPGAKHILIPTADAGSGHRSAAQALESAFGRLYPGQAHVTIVNPIHHPRANNLLRLYERAYLDVQRHMSYCTQPSALSF